MVTPNLDSTSKTSRWAADISNAGLAALTPISYHNHQFFTRQYTSHLLSGCR